MTGWDVLDKIVTNFSPIAAMVFFLAAGIIFAIGFFRHGADFLKHGFKQNIPGASLEKRFDDLGAQINGLHSEINGLRGEFHTEINGLRGEFHTELDAIKVNHFGHLKDFLTELTSILLDKKVINNQDKARLDNRLRGM